MPRTCGGVKAERPSDGAKLVKTKQRQEWHELSTTIAWQTSQGRRLIFWMTELANSGGDWAPHRAYDCHGKFDYSRVFSCWRAQQYRSFNAS
jgi:hypothetical protein